MPDRFSDEEDGSNEGGRQRSDVSPASTMASTTMASTPVVAAKDNNDQTITIDHRNNTRSGPSWFSPCCAFKVIVCLSIVGVLAYFIAKWLEVPGLNSQIKRLQAEVNRLGSEVDRLGGEVDRLEGENDRFESLNDRLNTTVEEFGELNDRLNATTNRLGTINEQLNVTNLELSERVDELTNQNEEFARLNNELNLTTLELGAEVDRFSSEIASLILETVNLVDLGDKLENVTDSLRELTLDQNATITALQLTLLGITTENTRLGKLNDDLTNIASFLNETTTGLGDSFEQITDILATQISVTRQLLLQNEEKNYRSLITNWDCEYRDAFNEKDYGKDFELLIPEADFNTVVQYIDNRILDEMCLNEADFTKYLEDAYGRAGLTSSILRTAVSVYTAEALDWYFPEIGEIGPSEVEWEDANYSCQNLTNKFDFPSEVIL